MIDYNHPSDVAFKPELMNNPNSLNHWFNGLTLNQARKEDLDNIIKKGWEPAQTYHEIQESMRYFVDIVADLSIAQSRSGKTKFENNRYIVEHVQDSKGFQQCPWEDSAWSSATETKVVNKLTNVILMMNYGTAHMAGIHWALEKGENNPYATSVEEYAKNFMDIPDFKFSKERWSHSHIATRRIFNKE